MLTCQTLQSFREKGLEFGGLQLHSEQVPPEQAQRAPATAQQGPPGPWVPQHLGGRPQLHICKTNPRAKQ